MALSLAGVPFKRLKRMAAHFLGDGLTVEATIHELVEYVDALVDDEDLLGPAVGAAVEQIDGPLLELAIEGLVEWVSHRLGLPATAGG